MIAPKQRRPAGAQTVNLATNHIVEHPALDAARAD